jgi:hypothetical protein
MINGQAALLWSGKTRERQQSPAMEVLGAPGAWKCDVTSELSHLALNNHVER